MASTVTQSKAKPWWTTVALISIPVVFLSLIGLLWSRKFFEFTGTEASSNVVAAALALGGGLLATMVTLIGLILKQSLDQRNADLKEEGDRRLAIEADRNRVLQEEAERRLKLEAAIRAVDLLGTDTGADTNVTQRTGALFSLAHLGLVDLSIDLVTFMRPKDLIGPHTTSSLLDIALRSNDVNAQHKAAEFLRDHSNLLLDDEGLSWPPWISLAWPENLDYLAKDYVLDGLIRALIAKPIAKWDEGNLNACVAFIAVAFRTETDERLRAAIALYLQELLPIYMPVYFLYLPTENLSIEDLRGQVAQVNTTFASTAAQRMVGTLRNWRGEKPFIG